MRTDRRLGADHLHGLEALQLVLAGGWAAASNWVIVAGGLRHAHSHQQLAGQPQQFAHRAHERHAGAAEQQRQGRVVRCLPSAIGPSDR